MCTCFVLKRISFPTYFYSIGRKLSCKTTFEYRRRPKICRGVKLSKDRAKDNFQKICLMIYVMESDLDRISTDGKEEEVKVGVKNSCVQKSVIKFALIAPHFF